MEEIVPEVIVERTPPRRIVPTFVAPLDEEEDLGIPVVVEDSALPNTVRAFVAQVSPESRPRMFRGTYVGEPGGYERRMYRRNDYELGDPEVSDPKRLNFDEIIDDVD